MRKIILQPTSNKIAYEHYVDTIEHAVPIETLKRHVDDRIYEKIAAQYPNGHAYVWGVMNGVKDVNKKKWEKIARGDITLFSKKGGIFASAVTTLTLHNKKLAQELWGVDKNGNTWENIYLLEDVKNICIPYKKLNMILGYKENNVIQGFSVLDDKQSEKLNMEYDLFSKETCEELSEREYMECIVKWDDGEALDIEKQGFRRREQDFLRNYLFKGKSSCVCGICGRTLPVSMMITSHIKKRSECSRQEKLDYKNIVMPMCKFGCDDLYEKGYIYVNDGIVKINSKKWCTDDLKKELQKINGRVCKYYNENTKAYFEAHRKMFGIENE